MGDRANVRMIYGHSEADTEERASIYFYTHWRGTDLPLIVRNALQKRWRWDDESYLARIIFNTLTDGDEYSETGFGIAPYICDNEHPIVEVDVPNQIVRFTGGSNYSSKRVDHQWSFENYVNLNESIIRKAYEE